jgi:lipopolysaccharide export system permease protein
MKLLDRYLFSIFGMAFLLVTLTFIVLFTAMDLSSRIARILSLKNTNTMSFLAHYYLIRMPMFLHLILPAVTLFASMFTVIQLQKTNELLPMITSGVSVRRLSMIFVAGAVVCAALMAVLDELVLPNLMEQISETDDLLISDRPQKGVYRAVPDGFWHIDELDGTKKKMKGATVTKNQKDGAMRASVILAETGEWDSKAEKWILRNGTIQPFDASGAPIFDKPGDQRPRLDPFTELVLDPPPQPSDFRRSSSITGRSYKYVELRELMRSLPHVPSYPLNMQLKFASPLGPIVLLFLGLPFVSGTQHRSFYRGIGLCLLLTVSYYAATFVCIELGTRGSISVAAAVWGPIGVFGLAGLVSFWRMKS